MGIFTARQRQAMRVVNFALGAVQNVSIAAIISQAAASVGIDSSLLMAIAQRESGLNPTIVNTSTGATGVMQLMPATWKMLGVTDPTDPVQNIYGGARYLAQLLAQFGGDLPKAVAAYDWGPTRVTNAVTHYGAGWLATAPTETQNYVAAITGVTADSLQAQAAAAQPPLTIDNSTGLPVDSSVDVSTLPSINSAGVISSAAAASDTGTIVALAALGAGAWLVSQWLGDL
jgi:soluble lytic murein transglycosylase-like protein